jgi:hypothetical protein
MAALLFSGVVVGKPGDINRCLDAGGQWVFTDQPCHVAVADATQADIDVPDARPGTCPAPTAEELLLRVRGALGKRDFNALSVLYLWDGMGDGQVDARIATLQGVIRDTLVRAQLEREEPEAPVSNELAVLPKAPPATGIIVFQTQGHRRDAPGPLVERRFGLTRAAGCFWLR